MYGPGTSSAPTSASPTGVINPLSLLGDILPTRKSDLPSNHSIVKNVGTTSAKTSSYEIVIGNQETPVLGDIVHLRITARDINKRPRNGGEDFWFATLTSNNASTSGKVVDYQNGTYSVYFFAGWEGWADIDITLVHSSDAVRFLRDVMWNHMRIEWTGGYESANGSKAKGSCALALSGDTTWTDMCKYPNSNALGKAIFMCTKQKGFPCDTLRTQHTDDDSKKRFLGTVRRLLGTKINLFRG